MSSEEKRVSDVLCQRLGEALKRQGTLDVLDVTRRTPDECLYTYKLRGAPDESTKFSSAGMVALTPDNVYVEAVVPHCPQRRQDLKFLGKHPIPEADTVRSLLLTPYMDLHSKCKIDQVHIHSGGDSKPTTHIHITCDLNQITNRKQFIEHHLAWWLGGKLGAYVQATCKKR